MPAPKCDTHEAAQWHASWPRCRARNCAHPTKFDASAGAGFLVMANIEAMLAAIPTSDRPALTAMVERMQMQARPTQPSARHDVQ